VAHDATHLDSVGACQCQCPECTEAIPDGGLRCICPDCDLIECGLHDEEG